MSKDRARYMLEVKSGLNSFFWRWTKAHLVKSADSILREAALNVPRTPEEMVIREQEFGRAKALLSIIDQIPNTIEMELTQEQKENEHESTQEAS